MNSLNQAGIPDLELEHESAVTISLTPEQLCQAAQRSATVQAADPWQVYLDAIAELAFEQWLQQHSLNLALRHSQTSDIQPLSVGKFRVYLTATGSLSEPIIPVPASAMNQQEHHAHFYVAVEIIEDLEQAEIRGFLRHDRLMHHLNLDPLIATGDGIYELPSAWFDRQPEQLLLYLSCLDVSAIPWSEPRLSAVEEQNLTHSFINVRQWLEDKLDDYAQRLGWVLLPAISLEPLALRSQAQSPAAEMNRLLAQLRSRGLNIPPQARGAYREDLWLGISLRLYAFTWLLNASEAQGEWSFLVLLGSASEASLPPGLKLQIADQDQRLIERVFTNEEDEAYLYGCVVGNWNETFQVSCELAPDEVLEYPPFALGAPAA